MGKSGKHVSKHKNIPRTEDEAAAWDKAAGKAGFDNTCAWIRATLNDEAKRLRVRVGETLDGET